MIRRPPRSTQSRSSAASDVYKRQVVRGKALICLYLEFKMNIQCLVLAADTKFYVIIDKLARDNYKYVICCHQNLVESLVDIAPDILKCITDEITKLKNQQLKEGYSGIDDIYGPCLLYTSPSPRDRQKSRMPSSA
eukprot:TRINITY_DN8437_c0_g1_i1.p1 TRINITY_DN8437_c0_g1~~TRINITY_DN8437_c0_g1_i1.p1  ORF type:complete len:136 (+),score=58.88 TRINITY_DN8437_c0_g1_i1:10-417(+)